eukprot:PLAT3513.1.p1 GENE.PLAT3513.1~~PLAT3513.1.p1  ORF type:complete len:1663 (+),score=781.97 PLAT3513.1:888-5876(+)
MLPQLSVLGGTALRRLRRAELLQLRAQPSLLQCSEAGNSSAVVTGSRLRLLWKVSLGGVAISSAAGTTDSADLLLPAFTLLSGERYNATVTVWHDASASSNSVTVPLAVLPGDVHAVIAGGRHDVPAAEALLLDGRQSWDADDVQAVPMTYFWQCSRLADGGRCLTRLGLPLQLGFQSAQPIVHIDGNTLPVDTALLFRLTVSKPLLLSSGFGGLRSSSAELAITARDSLGLPRVSLQQMQRRVPAGQRLRLVGSVDGVVGAGIDDGVTLTWSIDAQDLLPPLEQLFVSHQGITNAVLKPNALAGGAVYRFTLTARGTATQAEASASVLVAVNSAPLGGWVSAAQAEWDASAALRLYTGSWADAEGDLPLRYAFAAMPGEEDSDDAELRLSAQLQQRPSLLAWLPVTRATVRLVAYAEDTLGGRSRASLGSDGMPAVVQLAAGAESREAALLDAMDTASTLQLPQLLAAAAGSLPRRPACLSITCGVHGVCRNSTGECVCDAGFQGEFCNQFAPRDGRWTPWSAWSSCSSRCGDGQRERRRSCASPPPRSTGADCAGDWQQSATCFTRSCEESDPVVDGGYSEWSEWTTCSAECDAGVGGPLLGVQHRQRSCTSPMPSGGGADCMSLGPAQQRLPCSINCPSSLQHCPGLTRLADGSSADCSGHGSCLRQPAGCRGTLPCLLACQCQSGWTGADCGREIYQQIQLQDHRLRLLSALQRSVTDQLVTPAALAQQAQLLRLVTELADGLGQDGQQFALSLADQLLSANATALHTGAVTAGQPLYLLLTSLGDLLAVSLADGQLSASAQPRVLQQMASVRRALQKLASVLAAGQVPGERVELLATERLAVAALAFGQRGGSLSLEELRNSPLLAGTQAHVDDALAEQVMAVGEQAQSLWLRLLAWQANPHGLTAAGREAQSAVLSLSLMRGAEELPPMSFRQPLRFMLPVPLGALPEPQRCSYWSDSDGQWVQDGVAALEVVSADDGSTATWLHCGAAHTTDFALQPIELDGEVLEPFEPNELSLGRLYDADNGVAVPMFALLTTAFGLATLNLCWSRLGSRWLRWTAQQERRFAEMGHLGNLLASRHKQLVGELVELLRSQHCVISLLWPSAHGRLVTSPAERLQLFLAILVTSLGATSVVSGYDAESSEQRGVLASSMLVCYWYAPVSRVLNWILWWLGSHYSVIDAAIAEGERENAEKLQAEQGKLNELLSASGARIPGGAGRRKHHTLSPHLEFMSSPEGKHAMALEARGKALLISSFGFLSIGCGMLLLGILVALLLPLGRLWAWVVVSIGAVVAIAAAASLLPLVLDEREPRPELVQIVLRLHAVAGLTLFILACMQLAPHPSLAALSSNMLAADWAYSHTLSTQATGAAQRVARDRLVFLQRQAECCGWLSPDDKPALPCLAQVGCRPTMVLVLQSGQQALAAVLAVALIAVLFSVLIIAWGPGSLVWRRRRARVLLRRLGSKLAGGRRLSIITEGSGAIAPESAIAGDDSSSRGGDGVRLLLSHRRGSASSSGGDSASIGSGEGSGAGGSAGDGSSIASPFFHKVYTKSQERAVLLLQRVARGFAGRRRARRLLEFRMLRDSSVRRGMKRLLSLFNIFLVIPCVYVGLAFAQKLPSPGTWIGTWLTALMLDWLVVQPFELLLISLAVRGLAAESKQS